MTRRGAQGENKASRSPEVRGTLVQVVPGELPKGASGAELAAQEAATGEVSYLGLMWWRFKRNRMAVIGGILLILAYLSVLPAEFTAPYARNQRHEGYLLAPPQMVHFVRPDGRFSLRPFVYGLEQARDPVTLRLFAVPNSDVIYPVRLFPRDPVGGGQGTGQGGESRQLRLFGVESPGKIFLLGTDRQGRDMFSQILYGGRISLTVGFVGVVVTIVLGTLIGLFSGYMGNVVDDLIQRGIEIMNAFPTIPLWIALSAAIPLTWAPLKVFFAISALLSLIGWGGLARVVRGMTLSLRSEDYILAARMNGGTVWWMVIRHLLPAILSYVIVRATLAIPGMILGETALSYLGLGLHPPMVSWGVLLQQAQDITLLVQAPWVIAPVFILVVIVLSFNFLGDGLRDAVDPFSGR